MAHSRAAAVGLASLLNSLFEAALLGDARKFDQAVKNIGSKAELREVKDDTGRSALHYAALGGSKEICESLVKKHGLSINEQDKSGATPLALAAGTGKLPIVEALLSCGADASAGHDKDGVGPMHRAATAAEGGPAVLERLAAAGADANAPSSSGTPLCMAAHAGRADSVEWLLGQGADPLGTTTSGVPATMLAAAGGNVDCLAALLKAGASPTAAAPGGLTPLHVAATLRDEAAGGAMVDALVQAGADANAADDAGITPLLLAAARQGRQLVERLLPHTKPIPEVEWTPDGVMAHAATLGLVQQQQQQQGAGASKAQGAGGRRQAVIEMPEQPDAAAASKLKAEADAAYRTGDAHQAHELYTRSLRHDTSNHLVWANRSAAALKLGRHEEALEDARNSIALKPEYAKGWYREGAAHEAMQNWEDAALAYFEGQERDPDNATFKASFNRAIQEGRKQHQQRAQQQEQQQK